MKNIKHTILVVITLCYVTLGFSQHKRYTIRNGIGIQGGVTQFDLLTDNFKTKSNTGYLGGLTAWVNIPHKWYNVSYNIQMSENNIDISARPLASTLDEFVEYKLLTVQASFLFHAKLIGNNLTLDAGPMVQYNGELELKDQEKEAYVISGFNNLLAEDITDISRFNINGAVGLSAGLGRFSLRGQYIYGFTNILARLNDKNLNVGSNTSKFKGNQSMLTLTALLIF
ncbi:hypothetical protein J4050_00745 [Winogradskyella sp. DF17]|jgi:hypothetical protein|uniref:Outer membrane protein beta-barrel domain-containing protein n=1 Tax=Winogradskyella pelagia TaxID=2819984 RepID=A0ABS3SXN0_9FLAO|nr:hypothetical protein [Winogradskyella sp. DF17]MBO3115253.1 hypothetical protein [Winogradskyella sp. DF17]